MPNSKPKESYLLHAKISSDKASNQPTKIFHKCYNKVFDIPKREH